MQEYDQNESQDIVQQKGNLSSLIAERMRSKVTNEQEKLYVNQILGMGLDD